jgi:hypothetical protein
VYFLESQLVIQSLEPDGLTVPFSAASSTALVSSRFTLSRDVVDRRCEVRRGEFGCCVSCSSCFVSPCVSASFSSTGGLSVAVLELCEECRLVNDLVLSTGGVVASTVISLASSNVSCNISLSVNPGSNLIAT